MKMFQGFSDPWTTPLEACVVTQTVRVPPKGIELRLVFVLVTWLGDQFGFGPYALDSNRSVLLSHILNNAPSLSRVWAAAIFPDEYSALKYNNTGYNLSKAMAAHWEVRETGAAGYVNKGD